MIYKSKQFCKVCGSNDSFEIVSYYPTNKSYRGECCGSYLTFVKYDDEYFQRIMGEIRKILREKELRNDWKINKDNLVKIYGETIAPFILLNEVRMMAEKIDTRFEIV